MTRTFIFNLAGQTSHLDSMDNPYEDLAINCTAQLSILEACRHHNPEATVVFASTRQIYGRPQLPAGRREASDQPRRRQRDQQDRRRVVPPALRRGLRPSCRRAPADEHLRAAHAGQGRAPDLPRLLAPAAARGSGRSTVFGDGTQRRDFNYVDDAVRALPARRRPTGSTRPGLQPRQRRGRFAGRASPTC